MNCNWRIRASTGQCDVIRLRDGDAGSNCATPTGPGKCSVGFVSVGFRTTAIRIVPFQGTQTLVIGMRPSSPRRGGIRIAVCKPKGAAYGIETAKTVKGWVVGIGWRWAVGCWR